MYFENTNFLFWNSRDGLCLNNILRFIKDHMPTNTTLHKKQTIEKKYISVYCQECDTYFNTTTDYVGMVLQHKECGNNYIIVQDDEYKIINLSKLQKCDYVR